MGQHPGRLSIRDVSARSGLAASALRFYESAGLISSVGREGTRRVFDQSVVTRLAFITVSRRSGFTIREIRELIGTRSEGVTAWRPLVARKIAEIDAQIAHDTAVRDGLQHALNCTSDDILDCPHMQTTLAAAFSPSA